jgi:MerR family transcriptional regulator, light-induced transcriptional regulator
MRYTVAAAASAAHISPWRLRTWERRYGVPNPERSDTGRRMYSDEDLRLIKRMASLVDQGFPASQAASVALGERDAGAISDEAPPAADPRLATLIESARGLDEPASVATIREAAAELGWGEALESVVMPALAEIGRLWSRGELSVMQEHFCSQLVRRELMHAVAQLPDADPTGPLVLLACPEDEYHELGGLALWLLLRERGVRVLALGPDVPASELVAAARTALPDVVCLSGVAPASGPALAVAARALLAVRSGARVFVGGPAVASAAAADAVPATVLPQSLTTAVDVLMAEARA